MWSPNILNDNIDNLLLSLPGVLGDEEAGLPCRVGHCDHPRHRQARESDDVKDRFQTCELKGNDIQRINLKRAEWV